MPRILQTQDNQTHAPINESAEPSSGPANFVRRTGLMGQGYDAQIAALAPSPHSPRPVDRPPPHAGDSDPEMATRIGADVSAGMASANQGQTIFYRTNQLPGRHRGQNALYQDGYASPDYFEPCNQQGTVKRFHFVLLPGVSAFDAVDAWVSGFTVADCASTAMAVQLHAIAKEMGKPAFDEMCMDWTGPFIAQKLEGTPLDALTSAQSAAPETATDRPDIGWEEVGGKRYAVRVGDKAYAANHPDYIDLVPGGLWSGEHVICAAIQDVDGVPTPLWSGFGAAPQTSQAMLAEVYEHYRAAALQNPKYVADKFRIQLGNPVGQKVREHFESKHAALEAQGSSSDFFLKIKTAEDKLRAAFDDKAGFRIDEGKLYSWQVDTKKVGAAKEKYGGK